MSANKITILDETDKTELEQSLSSINTDITNIKQNKADTDLSNVNKNNILDKIGVLPIANGGTGSTTVEQIKKKLGIDNIEAMKYENGLPEKPPSPVSNLDNYSWEQINNIALSGRGKEYFALGATKSVTLSSAVLDTTTHNVMIIGINQDNDNSITFQTQNFLLSNQPFGSSLQWISSNVRTSCQNYYDAFPAQDYILTVSKGTCVKTNQDRNGTAVYNDETVWIPSEREMGLDKNSPISTANSTTSNAECTKGKNFSYEYYADAYKRKKKSGDNGSVDDYWLRSKHYPTYHDSYLCEINVLGDTDTTLNTSYLGVAPAFVIGNDIQPSGKITQNNEDVTSKVAALLGGAKVQVMSYVGTGTYGSGNPNSLTFSFKPKIIFFSEHNMPCMYIPGAGAIFYYSLNNVTVVAYQATTTWYDGLNKLVWYASDPLYQLNTSNYQYTVIAIG